MLKLAGLFLATTTILTTQTLAADWRSEPNIGAQGVQGSFATTDMFGSFRLDFYCTAHAGENRTIFMKLNTLPDAPLVPGNETTFPIILSYTFGDGSIRTAQIMVDWDRDDHGANVWKASFPMDKEFLNNFAHAQMLQLSTTLDEIISQYPMGGSSKAADNMIEYCYSGDYAYD